MKALVISLEASASRWNQTNRECSRLGIEAERLLAMDPAAGAAWFPNSRVTGGHLGLIATYDMALSLIQSYEDEWILILEDDARFNFRTRSLETIERLTHSPPGSVGAIHLGYMTGNELWWDQYPISKRLKIFLRPRSRIREAKNWISHRKGFEWEFPPNPPLQWGSQALLVRRVLAEEVRKELASFDFPQDNKINRCLHSRPDLFVRTRKPFVTQRAGKSVRLAMDRFTTPH